MSRALIIIRSEIDRRRVARWASKAPVGTRVEMKGPKRTISQNALMWVLLSEVASQVRWHGIKLTADDWKLMMLDALKREVRMVPNIDGNGFVSLGRSSSDLSKEEMGDLIELIRAFGAQHGVVFADDQSPAPAGIEEGRPRQSAHGEVVRSAGDAVAPSSPVRELEGAR